jgi:SSS family solute:Na+ symporter
MTCAYVFTARSASAVRQAQITMPLYMLMFPLLTFIAYFAVYHPALRIQSANEVFPDVVQAILSRPLTGLVMAGATLSALVVLTGVCLTVGSLVSRNLIPGLSSDQQRQWSKVIIVAYLLLSIAGAATSSQLLVTINNLFYFGIVQALPGMMGILFLRRMRPAAIIAGILAGDITAIVVFEFALPVDGVNAGLIGLLVNMAIVLFALRFFPDRERKPIAAMTRV